MSSLRTAVKSHIKTYKERSQLSSRKHLGLLEKHKDYVIRAKDYHRKQDQLKRLKRKAKEKNPDEFYFSMLSQKTSEGLHVIQDQKSYTKDELMLMKTQDLNYINMKKSIEAKKIESLKANLHFPAISGDNAKAQHIRFVDSIEEARSDKANRLQTEKELEERIPNGKNHKQFKSGAYSELVQRQQRLKKLESTRQHLEMKKHLMSGGKVRRQKRDNIGEAGPAKRLYKWKLERKK